METDAARLYRLRLAEKLADSLAAPLPPATRRRVYGTVSMPGKAAAVWLLGCEE